RVPVERLGGGDVVLLARGLRAKDFGLLHEVPALSQGGGTGSAGDEASHRGCRQSPVGHCAVGIIACDGGERVRRIAERERVQHCDRLIECRLDASLAGDRKMRLAPLSGCTNLARRCQGGRRQQTSDERCVSQISDRLHGVSPIVSEYILTTHQMSNWPCITCGNKLVSANLREVN